jgi:hypothetical protein
MSLCILFATNYQISYGGELWAIFDNIPCQRLHISQYKYTWLFYKSNFDILFFFIFCLDETNENSFLKVFQNLTYLLCRPFIIYLWRKVVCLWVKSLKVYHTSQKGPNPYYSPFLPYILTPIKNNESKVVKKFRRTIFYTITILDSITIIHKWVFTW